MTLIVCIAATIAALICFRWARTLALFAILAAVIYWIHIVNAHAYESIVRCPYGGNMTDYQCRVVMREAHTAIDFWEANPNIGAQAAPVRGCRERMGTALDANPNSVEYTNFCNNLYTTLYFAVLHERNKGNR